MERSFEVQHLESLRNVQRKSPRLDGLASTFNVLILMLGFTCIAIGYLLSNVSREQLAEWLGQPKPSIERPASPTSVEKSVSRISKTWIELVS